MTFLEMLGKGTVIIMTAFCTFIITSVIFKHMFERLEMWGAKLPYKIFWLLISLLWASFAISLGVALVTTILGT